MPKFFNKQKEKCSVCGVYCEPKKKIRGQHGVMVYCQICWEKINEFTRAKVKLQLDEIVSKKRKIGMSDLKNITNEITKDLIKK